MRQTRTRNTAGIAKRTDYYAAQNLKDLPPQCFETDFLRRVEDEAAPLLVKLRDGSFKLSDPERSRLALFMALLFARTPESRDAVEGLAAKMIEAMVRKDVHGPDFARTMREANKRAGVSDSRIEELRRALLRPGALRCRLIPEFTLVSMLNVTDTVARIIFELGWYFAIPPLGKHFLTSDNPVFWYDPTAPSPFCNGLASRNMVLTFPIGPELALLGSWHDGSDSYSRVDDAIVDNINGLVISSAERWVIAARKEEAKTAWGLWQHMKSRGVRLGLGRDPRLVLQPEPTPKRPPATTIPTSNNRADPVLPLSAIPDRIPKEKRGNGSRRRLKKPLFS
jgi:uncharacterized protein DUF4238